MKKKTVSVIGGGLAGLYAAHQAAIKGMQVTLYEKNKIGTKHNCGELFTEIYTSVPEECKISKIDTFIFKIGNEEIRIEFGEKSPFIMTDKNLHESIMKNKCIDAGVEVLENVIYDYPSDNKAYIIDASGIKGYIGTHLGKAMTITCGFDPFNSICKSNESLFMLRDDNLGYLWAFPKGALYNIGDGIYNYKQKSELSKTAIANKLGIFNAVVIHSGGGLLPMPTMNEYYNTITNNSIIKVGNAAGLVNPVLGGGEHLAVLSGMLAGEIVSKLTYPTSKYYEALDDIIGDEMRFGISLFEYLKKQDRLYTKEFLKQKLIDRVNIDLINKNIRKSMAKWIKVDEVKEAELVNFIDKGE